MNLSKDLFWLIDHVEGLELLSLTANKLQLTQSIDR